MLTTTTSGHSPWQVPLVPLVSLVPHSRRNSYAFISSIADNRSKGWPLVDSPVPTLVYTLIYLSIVWAGPKLMKKKNPLKLTWLLIPYNLAMAVLNGYIAFELLVASTRLRYSYVCQPVTYINHKEELRVSLLFLFPPEKKFYFFPRAVQVRKCL